MKFILITVLGMSASFAQDFPTCKHTWGEEKCKLSEDKTLYNLTKMMFNNEEGMKALKKTATNGMILQLNNLLKDVKVLKEKTVYTETEAEETIATDLLDFHIIIADCYNATFCDENPLYIWNVKAIKTSIYQDGDEVRTTVYENVLMQVN